MLTRHGFITKALASVRSIFLWRKQATSTPDTVQWCNNFCNTLFRSGCRYLQSHSFSDSNSRRLTDSLTGWRNGHYLFISLLSLKHFSKGPVVSLKESGTLRSSIKWIAIVLQLVLPNWTCLQFLLCSAPENKRYRNCCTPTFQVTMPDLCGSKQTSSW